MSSHIIFPNLRAELARSNLRVQDVAAILELSRDSTGAKLSGKGKIYLDEAFRIRNAFFPKLGVDYLFAKESNDGKDTA